MNTIEDLFVWFLGASTRGTVLAAVVVAIQIALRGKLPAKWHYALWLPVIVVLVAPELPRSPLSIENQLVVVPQLQFETAALPVKTVPIATPILTEQQVSVPAPKLTRVNWTKVLATLWLTGVVGFFGFGMGSYLRTIRQLRLGTIEPDVNVLNLVRESAKAAGLRRIPKVLVSTKVDSPAVAGFFRPTLLLPAKFRESFSTDEARLILLHEMIHLKRHDLAANWLLCGLQAIHWCNPLLWLAFRRIRADREMACDARVLELTQQNQEDKRSAYGNLLLKLDRPLEHPALNLGFVGIFNPGRVLRSRVRAIARHSSPHPGWKYVGIGLIATMLTLCATRAMTQAPSNNAPIIHIIPTFFDVPAGMELDLKKPRLRNKSTITIKSAEEFAKFLETMTPAKRVDEAVYQDLFIRSGSEVSTANQVGGQMTPTPEGMTPILAGWTISAKEANGKVELDVTTRTTRTVHQQDHATVLSSELLDAKLQGDFTTTILEMKAKGRVQGGDTFIIYNEEPEVPTRNTVVALTVSLNAQIPEDGVLPTVPFMVAKNRMGTAAWRAKTFASALTLMDEARISEAEGDYELAFYKFAAAKQHLESFVLVAPEHRPEVVKPDLIAAREGIERTLVQLHQPPTEGSKGNALAQKVEIQAAEQAFDQARGLLIAKGNAEASTKTYDSRSLLIKGDRIEYDHKRGLITTVGNFDLTIDGRPSRSSFGSARKVPGEESYTTVRLDVGQIIEFGQRNTED